MNTEQLVATLKDWYETFFGVQPEIRDLTAMRDVLTGRTISTSWPVETNRGTYDFTMGNGDLQRVHLTGLIRVSKSGIPLEEVSRVANQVLLDGLNGNWLELECFRR